MISAMPFSQYCGWSNEITGIQVLGKLCSLHIDLTVVSIPLMRLKEVNGGSDSCYQGAGSPRQALEPKSHPGITCVLPGCSEEPLNRRALSRGARDRTGTSYTGYHPRWKQCVPTWTQASVLPHTPFGPMEPSTPVIC